MSVLHHMFKACLLLACLMASVAHGQAMPEVAKPQVPTNEADCLQRGGAWTTLGLPMPGKAKVCDLKTKDAGKSCTDSKQCEGVCLADKDAEEGASTAGACSAYVAEFGTYKRVTAGKVQKLSVQ